MAGTLPHVMGRGVERTTIYRGDDDGRGLVARVAALTRDRHWVVYPWALLTNHFHLMARTGTRDIRGKVARFLGVTTSALNRLAVSPDFLAVAKHLKAL